MDERAKGTEPQTGDAPADAGEALVVETVEQKADSAVVAIAPKVGGSQMPGNEQSDKRTQAAPSGQSKPKSRDVKRAPTIPGVCTAENYAPPKTAPKAAQPQK